MSATLKNSSLPPVEALQGPGGFEAFLERNQKGVAALAVLIVVGAVGLVIYRGVEKSRQETAGAALNKASDLASYQAVVTGNAGTKAAGSAMVLLANAQWTDGKQDEAIGTLRKFIAEFPDHAAIPTAKANLGAKLLAQGKSGDAAKVFDEIVADPAARYIAPFALISLGDIARAAGDLTKAEASYNKVKNDFPGSDFADNANRRLAILKTKPPVEIEAPPAPAAAPTPDANIQPNIISPPNISINPGNPAEDVPPVQFPTQDQTPPPGSDPEENPPAPAKP